MHGSLPIAATAAACLNPLGRRRAALGHLPHGLSRPAAVGALLGVLDLRRRDPLLAVLLADRAGHGALLAPAAADLLVVTLLVALVSEVVGDVLAALLHLDDGLALLEVLLFQFALGAHNLALERDPLLLL